MLHSQPCPYLHYLNEIKVLNATTFLMAYSNSLDFLTTFYDKINAQGNLALITAKTIQQPFKLHAVLTELISA